MATSQAFRVALHIPVLDPVASQSVVTVLGGDLYTSGWASASGGGGLADAPNDGVQYARQSLAWAAVTPNPTWSTLSGKPATFPPTLPIDWSNITGQPATYPPTLPIAWTDVSGKPATFPPSTHSHPQSEVTNLVTDLAGKAPAVHTHTYASLTGIPATFAPSAHGHAQADVTNLVTDLLGKEPSLPAGGTAANFLRGDRTWQAPPTGSGGIGEAPIDGQVYNRRGSDATWQVAGGGAGVTDGDKGDIVVSASGASWLFDSAVVTAAARTVLDDATVAAMLATLGGAPLVHTHAQADVTNLASDLGLKAPLASPAFTGNPTAPTPAAGDSDTSIATTAFVSLAVSTGISDAIIDCGTF